MCATTRQNHHQVAAFENQQCFTHRATTDVQRLRDFLLLNALSRLELAANDPLGKVMSNLLSEAVRGLERHDYPSKKLFFMQVAECIATDAGGAGP
ncbi:hypothetical protein KPSA3_04843 [Pseudomonas syringae pv. actinidiae]|uniref:Uncharacterized protein n=2 Tax=Pseudomonas syringae pv. actinidiae TaxID=103796 RepID=A0AAN4Q8G4_PSESF|nr:hypothetical protein KPSA3_04843 [Pseudomonas syringae pv. actinidiae]